MAILQGGKSVMYVIEHAILNLGRNKGRNILLGIIIFVIITAAVITLAIFNTTGAIIEETRHEPERMVRVAPMNTVFGEDIVSLEQFLAFAESEYVSDADIRESHTSIGGILAIYFLNSPDMLRNFEAELRGKGLPDNYFVRPETASFGSVAGQLESLNSLTFTFLIITLALGAFIMTLLSIISIRERKYEIGVLRAMGMKKKSVALGLWVEIIVITCICFALGMGAGALLSGPVSNIMLAGQGNAENIDVSINILTAMQIFAVAILLASIAGIISTSRITKCEPIKILMERN